MRRLSGWVRLWIAFAVIVWTFGGCSAVMIASQIAPLDRREMVALAVPVTFYAALPLVVALVFIAIKWIWRGFRPASPPSRT